MYKLPKYYKGIEEFDYLQNNLILNEEYIRDSLKKLSNELFIVKSTDSGLKNWAITLNSSEDKIEILTKLNGSKTITKINLALIIKNILKQDIPVEVTEFNNQYRILIGVHNIKNLEKTQELLKKELKNIIPSHLILELYFNSLIWEKFDEYNKIWRIWDSLNLSWSDFENYNEDTVLKGVRNNA